MMLYLGVGFAGALGAMLRFAVSRLFLQFGWLGFPYATLAVNVLGSLLIGFLAFSLQAKWGGADHLKTVLVTGFLGGFTTFSAFSLETVLIIEQGEFTTALIYVSLTLALCLLACVLGASLAKIFA